MLAKCQEPRKSRFKRGVRLNHISVGGGVEVSSSLVEKIANRVQLQVSSELLSTYTKQLRKMLDYVDKIDELDEGSCNDFFSLVSCSAEREDAPVLYDGGVIVQQAPQRKGQAFQVPQVVD